MNLDKQGTIDFIFQYLIFAAENYYVEPKKPQILSSLNFHPAQYTNSANCCLKLNQLLRMKNDTLMYYDDQKDTYL